MKKWLKNMFGITLVVALMAACMGAQIKNDALVNRLHAYQKAVRWGGVKDVLSFVRSDLRMSYATDGEQLEIVSYDVIEGPVIGAEDRASQVVKIQYYERGRITIRNIIDNQIWEYDGDTRQWWLITRPPMPR